MRDRGRECKYKYFGSIHGSSLGMWHATSKAAASHKPPHAAWQKPLALPKQLLVIDTYLSEKKRNIYK